MNRILKFFDDLFILIILRNETNPMRILPLFFLIIGINTTYAQKEASHWFFSPYGYIDFTKQNPELEMREYNYQTSGQFKSSISDSLGNLLFHTDGRNFFNKNGEYLINGQNLYGEVSRSTQTIYTFKKPEGNNLFYTVVTELNYTNPDYAAEGSTGWTLQYSMIDIPADGSLGEVLVKFKPLTHKANDALAIMKGDDGNIWIITLGIWNGSEIWAYHVTAEGISETPVVTRLATKGGGSHYHLKSSPDNKKLVFARQSTPEEILEVYDFDYKSGKFSLKFNITFTNEADRSTYPYTIKFFPYYYEFSPCSNNLFIIEILEERISALEAVNISTLLRYDLSAPNNYHFINSRTEVFTYPIADLSGSVGRMQLAPDNKIYIGYRPNYLSSINNPSECEEFEFTLKAIEFPDWPGILPTFPAFFFKGSIENNIQPIIVADTLACAGSTIVPRASINDHYNEYHWLNSITMEEFFSIEPDIVIPLNESDKADTTMFYLKATNNNGCAAYDSFDIVSLPVWDLNIVGNQTVCPGAKEIYFTNNNELNDILKWHVEGGTIVNGQDADSISIDWGNENPHAYLKVDAINTFGCRNTIPELPVNINKELSPNLPVGIDSLNCVDSIYNYFINQPNNSSYKWHVINGNIVNGQETLEVNVQWSKEALNGWIWVEQTNMTDLANCYGKSDTLEIINPKNFDNRYVNLHSVSGNLIPDMVKIDYSILHHNFYKDDFTLIRKPRQINEWSSIADIIKTSNEIILDQPFSDSIIYDYKIVGSNLCSEIVESEVHNNIVLSAQLQENFDINLEWNTYLGWKEGVEKHELFRKLNREEDFTLYLSHSESENLILKNLSDGLEHCYYINSRPNNNEGFFSISNIACISYAHPIKIPNVITPNGDGKNDYLKIVNLELYPDNVLQIFNRHGMSVFEKIGYNNDWQAVGLPPGIYFYFLSTKKPSSNYKGWVQVFK